MTRRPEYWWRLFSTGLSFAVFGVGGIVISLTVFPVIYVVSFNLRTSQRRCQYVVHLAFRFFILMMRTLGVITYEIIGAEKLRSCDSRLIIANHPSLLDVVFIISMLPHALCVVKKAAWSNPFMAGVMWSTGYIPNDEPETLIRACVASLNAGDTLVMFPEGTRTTPGYPIKLKRGAASIIIRSGAKFTPLTITCKPTTLTKAERWYQIPNTRVHFRVTVRYTIYPRPLIADGETLSQASRKLSQFLKDILENGIDDHSIHHHSIDIT